MSMAEKVTDVGAGPWARLAAEAGRLQVLYQQGRREETLAAVQECRTTMAGLDEPQDADPAAAPWMIRESILGLGVLVAHDLGEWAQALDLNGAVRQSQQDRRATEVELAVTMFNDYGPLLRLGQAADARDLLYQCRAIFGRAEDVVMMGNTLSALADADAHRGHVTSAVDEETDALRMKYRGTDPEAIAVSHYNLANYLMSATSERQAVWAHRLAAAVIRYQTGSPRLTTSIQSIGRLVGNQNGLEPPQSPLSFNDVCLFLDSMREVRFAELFATLPARAESGQAAIDEVMRLTADIRDSAIEQSVAAWEPIISALVAARQPETADEVTPLLDDALAELSKSPVWSELVTVLQRIQAGPGFHDDRTVDDLDPVSASVARRARSALAGEFTVDPTAWRALAEDD